MDLPYTILFYTRPCLSTILKLYNMTTMAQRLFGYHSLPCMKNVLMTPQPFPPSLASSFATLRTFMSTLLKSPSPLSHTVSQWLMMFHIFLWCLMMSHNGLWCLIISQCLINVMVSHDVSLCIKMSYDVLQCLTMFHGVS